MVSVQEAHTSTDGIIVWPGSILTEDNRSMTLMLISALQRPGGVPTIEAPERVIGIWEYQDILRMCGDFTSRLATDVVTTVSGGVVRIINNKLMHAGPDKTDMIVVNGHHYAMHYQPPLEGF